MAREPDELAKKRGWPAPDPSGPAVPESTVPDTTSSDRVDRDASDPDPSVVELRATARGAAADARDVAAAARDAAADARDELALGTGGDDGALGRALAARDRVAGALDRREGAVDRLRAAEHLNRSYRDTLTGAVNRDLGREELGHEVDRAHRSQSALVIAFLDVVGLKRVNDEHGHAAGDEVLSSLGAALRAGLRSYDVVVRYGGDEFVCALPGSSLTDASRRFVDVRRLLSASSPGSSVSIGLAELQDDESLDEVITRADLELYEGRKADAASRKGPT